MDRRTLLELAAFSVIGIDGASADSQANPPPLHAQHGPDTHG